MGNKPKDKHIPGFHPQILLWLNEMARDMVGFFGKKFNSPLLIKVKSILKGHINTNLRTFFKNSSTEKLEKTRPSLNLSKNKSLIPSL